MSDSLDIGVFFGGRSVEHEVSVLSAQQVMAALPAAGFRAVPVYVAKSGRWYTGDVLRELERFRDVDALLDAATEIRMHPSPSAAGELLEIRARQGFFGGGGRGGARIDLAMPLIHGSHGEDGTLQGFFELSDLPYTGCGVAASALSMDKALAKAVLRDAGLPVIEHLSVDRAAWKNAREQTCQELRSRFGYPAFVKPVSLGSSIGVSRADSDDSLEAALDLAFVYDSRCLVEPAQEGAIDINCSVLGRGSDVRTSVCEQPVSSGPLSYADKYLSKGGAKGDGMKGARRLIPAPLSGSLTSSIQGAAAAAFRAIEAEGVVRVDFLVDPGSGTFAVNEVNTVPGSLAFYLWEPSGIPFPDLLSRTIDMARQRHAEKAATTFSIDTWLLRGRPG